MLLYLCITLVLFVTLIISISACRNNVELKIKRSICFDKSIYNFLFISLILLFWFLTAFRGDSIGNDTVNYLGYYKQIAKSGINTKLQIELGYQYFCLLLSKINPNPYFLLIVSATICYGVCGICIYKKSDNILYSTLLLFCVAFSFFTNAIRQSIAMVIVLVAYLKIKDGKKVLPIVLILFASLFHKSALLTLLWFVYKYIPKKPNAVITFALIIIILAITGILNSLLTRVLKEYQSYFYSDYAGTGWLGTAYYVLRALVFYLFIYIANKKEEKTNSLEIANTIFLLITVCLGFSVNLFNRASLYFLLITVIDIPNAFNSGRIRNRGIWMFIMGIIMLAYFMVTLIMRPEWNNLYPYKFFWD